MKLQGCGTRRRPVQNRLHGLARVFIISVILERGILDVVSEKGRTRAPGDLRGRFEIMSGAESIISRADGKEILARLQSNIALFKSQAAAAGLSFAAESVHAIQPLLIGDPQRTKEVTGKLFDAGILATGISYPVVSPGRDEIRIQINASHGEGDINEFVATVRSFLQ